VTPSKRDIAVKQSHIDHGFPGVGSQCAIARAIAEAVPEARTVVVYRTGSVDNDDLEGYAKLTFKGGVERIIPIPSEVTLAMVIFDVERKMQPLGFSIPLLIDFPVDLPPNNEFVEPIPYKGGTK
jgi:hypothetical protein